MTMNLVAAVVFVLMAAETSCYRPPPPAAAPALEEGRGDYPDYGGYFGGQAGFAGDGAGDNFEQKEPRKSQSRRSKDEEEPEVIDSKELYSYQQKLNEKAEEDAVIKEYHKRMADYNAKRSEYEAMRAEYKAKKLLYEQQKQNYEGQVIANDALHTGQYHSMKEGEDQGSFFQPAMGEKMVNIEKYMAGRHESQMRQRAMMSRSSYQQPVAARIASSQSVYQPMMARGQPIMLMQPVQTMPDLSSQLLSVLLMLVAGGNQQAAQSVPESMPRAEENPTIVIKRQNPDGTETDVTHKLGSKELDLDDDTMAKIKELLAAPIPDDQ